MKKNQPSQKELINATNKVNNNPHSIDARSTDWDDKEVKRSKEMTLYDNRIDRIVEAYRKTRQSTSLNRIVSKDEGEPDEKLTIAPSAKKEWDKARETWKKQIRKDSAQYRLKKKGAVPTKDGKRMFEEQEILQEDLNRFLSSFRKLYASPKSMTFRNWITVMEGLLDTIE